MGGLPPSYLTGFVGRTEETALLVRQTTESRLVTVVGFGGVGKSRLVAESAYNGETLCRGRPLIRIDVADAPIELLEAAVEDVLAQSGLAPRGEGSLAARLGDSSVLLLLDDCGDLDTQRGEFVVNLLRRCPNASVLATARRPLGLHGEVILPLAGLAVDSAMGRSEALELLEARAQAVDPTFVVSDHNLAACDRLVRHFEGNPFAIELVSSQFSAAGPEVLCRLLTEGDDAASQLGGSGLAADRRGDTLAEVVDKTIASLDESTRRRFADLTLLRGDFDLTRGARLTGIGEFELLQTMRALLSSSLVVRSDQRNAWHVPTYIRQHAVHSIADQRSPDAGHRYVVAVLEMVERCRERFWGSSEADAMALIEREYDDIRGALESAKAAGEHTLLMCLVGAVAPACDRLNKHEECLVWLRHARDGVAPASIRARLLNGLGLLSMIVGDEPAATAALREAQEIAEGEDVFEDVFARHHMGVAAIYRSDPEALALLLRARDHALAEGYPTAAAWSELFAGSLYLASGDLHAVEECVSAARSQLGSDASPEMLCWIGFLEGTVAMMRGNTLGAIEAARAALAGFAELERTWGVAACGLLVASLLASAGAREEALAVAEESELVRAQGGAAGLPPSDRWVRAIRAQCGVGRNAPPPRASGRLVDAGDFAARLAERLHDLSAAERDASTPRLATDEYVAVLRQEGDVWYAAFDGRERRFRSISGFGMLKALIDNGGSEVSAIDLSTASSGSNGTVAVGELLGTPGDAGERLDRQAVAEYRSRLQEIEGELDEADRWNDSERATALRWEKDFITSELTVGLGLGGRSRRDGSEIDRARQRVTKAIRLAIERLREFDGTLGEHLEESVHTGAYCSYRPDPTSCVAWSNERPVTAGAV